MYGILCLVHFKLEMICVFASCVLFVLCIVHSLLTGLLFSFRSKKQLINGESHQYTDPRKRPHQGQEDGFLESTYQFSRDKVLFHRLQNLEDHPKVHACAHKRLLEIFDIAISAGYQDPRSILAIKHFSPSALREFLTARESSTLSAYESYLLRRRNGGSRELLSDLNYAKYWLQISAPIRFVDGAWLGSIHGTGMSASNIRYSKTAWQIFSEELGDGVLAMNHVHVFSNLLKSVGVDLPEGNKVEFIDPRKNYNANAGVWLAAITPLLIANQAQEYLPEILGFNLAYEMISLPTLLAAHELKELGLDSKYFDLHITIDNSASGHTALAEKIVISFLEDASSSIEREQYWRRIQAGFQLCEYTLSVATKETPQEVKALEIFSKKVFSSQVLHKNCASQIGGRYGLRLFEWLDSQYWEIQKLEFLRCLGASHWIHSGCPERSKLIKLLKWDGRMFGAFTDKEIDILQEWIISLNPHVAPPDDSSSGKFKAFAKRSPQQVVPSVFNGGNLSGLRIDLNWHAPIPAHPPPNLGTLQSTAIPTLLLVSTIPLQHVLRSPFQAAAPSGMIVLLVLRHIYNLAVPKHSVIGMDSFGEDPKPGILEYAMELMLEQRHSQQSLDLAPLDSHIPEAWAWLQHASHTPAKNLNFLLGAQLGFAKGLYMNEQLDETFSAKFEGAQGMFNIGEMVTARIIEAIDVENQDVREGFWSVISMLRNGN